MDGLGDGSGDFKVEGLGEGLSEVEGDGDGLPPILTSQRPLFPPDK